MSHKVGIKYWNHLAKFHMKPSRINGYYNGVFGCHGNTCHVILIGAFFCMIHSISPINVCTDFEINRYKIDEFRQHAKILFYLTSLDAKSYGSNSGFHVFGELDL